MTAMTQQEAQTAAESHERACPACLMDGEPCVVAAQLRAAVRVGPMWRALAQVGAAWDFGRRGMHTGVIRVLPATR